MTATSHSRGWSIEHDGDKWVYCDTKNPCFVESDTRPCKRCGEKPTAEGHDACIGHVDGAASVCCGHGVMQPWTTMKSEIE